MIKNWPTDDSVEWLNPADVEIAMHCVQVLSKKDRPIEILEVGVWKGGWSFTLCDNIENIFITGIDPYPNLQEIKKRVELKSLKYKNFKLHANWSEIKEKVFHIIHLDAEHTEQAVANDLIKCLNHLAVGGILIIDDIRHPYFPGVACSAYNFIVEHKLVMLIYSEYKAYLCREQDFTRLQFLILESIKKSKLIFEMHINENNPDKIHYLENPTIRGFPVILCVDESNKWRALPEKFSEQVRDPKNYGFSGYFIKLVKDALKW